MRVLAIVAHPDDETLGCGGTLIRHAERGDEVRIVVVCDGVSSRGNDEAELLRRRKAARSAATVLGARDVTLLDQPDNRLDQVPLLEIVQLVEGIIREANPDIIYTHHQGDLNIDHERVHRAVVTACRPLPNSAVRLIAAMEILSSTEWASPSPVTGFSPNLFVDISLTLNRKIKALHCYTEEMRPFPHPRSEEAVRALAIGRGAAAGFAAAEAFVVIRMRVSVSHPTDT